MLQMCANWFTNNTFENHNPETDILIQSAGVHRTATSQCKGSRGEFKGIWRRQYSSSVQVIELSNISLHLDFKKTTI